MQNLLCIFLRCCLVCIPSTRVSLFGPPNSLSDDGIYDGLRFWPPTSSCLSHPANTRIRAILYFHQAGSFYCHTPHMDKVNVFFSLFLVNFHDNSCCELSSHEGNVSSTWEHDCFSVLRPQTPLHRNYSLSNQRPTLDQTS
jgi:hypothetical protein